MFSKNQLIESANQSIDMALTVRSVNFSFFKSFPKLPNVKQLIEMTNQLVVFHLLWKTLFLLKNMINLVLDQVKSGLTNSNLPRLHAHKQQPSLQANFIDLETTKLQV